MTFVPSLGAEAELFGNEYAVDAMRRDGSSAVAGSSDV